MEQKMLSPEQIKQIADELDSGFKCYWNKKTAEIVCIPDPLQFYDFEDDPFKEENEKLENDLGNFLEIERMQTYESFQLMVDFVEETDLPPRLEQKLVRALENKKPFRNFKFEIDNSGEYRQKWFDFKNRRLQEWVINKFEEIRNL